MKKIIFFHAAIIAGALSTSQANADHSVKTSSLPSAVVCPSGYILVDQYTLPDGTTVVPQFCVMKYEAKQSFASIRMKTLGYIPVSVPSKLPWVGLNWNEARNACDVAGANLISENQWLSIAHQVTSVASNWTGGAVGTGALFSGHNDNAPAHALAADKKENDGYYGIINTEHKNQRRTLNLPNGNIIWDFAGNVYEWTDAIIAAARRVNSESPGNYSYNISENEYPVTTLPVNMRPPSPYNANNGMGRYYTGSGETAYNNDNKSPDKCTAYCASKAAFMRGGDWNDGAGVFALDLDVGRSYVNRYVGFRCTR